ncbi:hypothetical protein V1522DRAFT_443777 [Lipomyces starkeyi]
MLEWDYRRLTLETLLRYASNVNKKCGYSNIWGFIDGTFRPTTRPTENQLSRLSGASEDAGREEIFELLNAEFLYLSSDELLGDGEFKRNELNILEQSAWLPDKQTCRWRVAPELPVLRLTLVHSRDSKLRNVRELWEFHNVGNGLVKKWVWGTCPKRVIHPTELLRNLVAKYL